MYYVTKFGESHFWSLRTSEISQSGPIYINASISPRGARSSCAQSLSHIKRINNIIKIEVIFK